MTKKKDKADHIRAGRPTVMTAEVVKLLLDGFAYSMTDEQACLFAGISKQALYDYCDITPGFTDQKELLKHKPSLKAKMNLVKKLGEEDTDVSKRRSERKNKDEFSLRQEQTGAEGRELHPVITDEQMLLIAQNITNNLNKLDNKKE